jgi:ribosomal RNA-processing protein 12
MVDPGHSLAGFSPGDPVAELYAKHRRSPQPESQAVTAVLEAVAEILRQEHIPPSPTAVFAAVMSSLERAAGDAGASPEASGAMLTVLGVALEHAPTAPVLSKLPASMQVLLAVGRAAQDSPPALRGVVHCIGYAP